MTPAVCLTTAVPATRPLRVACFLGASRWAETLTLARHAEAVGFDAVALGEHFLLRFGPASLGPADGWSRLAALAAATERVQLGMLASCTSFHHPALLARLADTVDEISGGRLVLGLGAGWHEPEFRALGVPFDHRVDRFAEAIEVIHTLLRTGQADFAGRYYQIRDGVLPAGSPRPGGPPILIGTTGPRMLALAARYAAIWDTNFQPLAALPALQAAADAACVAIGRDPATLARSATVAVALPGARHLLGPAITGTTAELAAQLGAYADAGFTQLAVWLAPETPAAIDAFAPVLGRLARA